MRPTQTRDFEMRNMFLTLFCIASFALIFNACKEKESQQCDCCKVTFAISNATEITERSARFEVSVLANNPVIDKGICYSKQNIMPTTADNTISKSSGVGNFNVTLIDLIENSEYYVRPYAIVCGVTYYGDIKNFTTLQDGGSNEEGVVINGTRWATRNVNTPGTFTANPKDAGRLFQWGSNVGWSNTDPLTATDGIHTWRDLSENNSIWLQEKNPCPTGWRVPTHLELCGLMDFRISWSKLNGVWGCFFGSGDQKMFLPAAGCRSFNDGKLDDVGAIGYYWSCAPYESESAFLYFFRDGWHGTDGPNRSQGSSVRCVLDN